MIPSATLDQIAGHPCESITLIMVAETRAGDQARLPRSCTGAASLLPRSRLRLVALQTLSAHQILVDVLGRHAQTW